MNYEELEQLLQADLTMHEALQQSAAYLASCGIEDAQNDAWLLFEHVTGISRARYLIERSRIMNAEDRSRYLGFLQKRGMHIPLQHLTGEQEFMGLTFQVNEHVLIPRQDTEVLVEEALKYMQQNMQVLDLCTGSGCIAISLKKLSRCDITVDASDISAEALQTAKCNAENLEADVRFIHSDLFDAICDTYDMIVSNPPYIQTAVIEELSEEVRLHEPYGALDGKEDGLYFYRKIVAQGREHLKTNGWMLFEIGYDQGEAVSQMMKASGFTNVKVLQDLAGLDRVVFGQRTAG